MEDASRDVQRSIITDSVRRHIVFVLVIALLCTGAAAAFTVVRHAKYTSTAKVLIQPLPGNPLSPEALSSGTQITVAMNTEAGLVTSPQVTALAKRAMQPVALPPPGAVHALVPPNTTIVQVRVTARSAPLAAAGAQAYAQAFLDSRRSQAFDIIHTQVAHLVKQQTAAANQLAQATAKAASVTPPPGIQTQVQLYASRLAAIQTSIGDLQATAISPGKVIDSAERPVSPDGLSALLVILAALVIGLGLGVALAIWRERRDDRVRITDGESVAGIAFISALPGNRRLSPRQVASLAADDVLRSCYRRARAAVIASAAPPSVLVVSSVGRSADEPDPAGEVAASLAWSLTGAGFVVTLVDATIGQGKVAELLGIETGPGLSEQLIANGSAVPRTEDALGMSVVPAGRDPEASREFYAGARLANSLAWFTKQSDYVIVAGPPVDTPDGEAVALAGDALVLVVVDRVTTHENVWLVLERVGQLSIRVVGAVGLQRRTQKAPRPGRGGRSGATAPRPQDPPAQPVSTSQTRGASTRGDDGR